MVGLKKLGKRLKRARINRSAGIAPSGETLIVPRFTTMPVGQQTPGVTPFIPYKRPGQMQKEVYIVESDIIKTGKEKEKEKSSGVSVNIATKGGGEANIEEEIAKKIRESPFKLKFKTLSIQDMQKAPEALKAPPKYKREIRKEFLAGGMAEEKGTATIDLLRKVNRVLPLITLTQGVEKKVVSYATIKWNEERNALIYKVHEPELNDEEKELLEELKNILKEKLDVDFEKIRGAQAYNYIIAEFNKIVKRIGIKFTPEQQLKFNYFVYRDFIGLEKLEPLMHDPNIEDISCVGYSVPIFIYHRDPLFNQIVTDVVFKSKKKLDSFVLKLAQKCGKNLTLAEPLMDGALPDGSRVQATYGTKEIARRGSNFTIRKFTSRPMTPVDLINLQTIDAGLLAYLWFVIENNMSVLVSGATATGKTTFLNAISLFIKPESKIITIEDTAELRLPLPNWIAAVARPGFGGKGYGEITMYDLLKAGLRQRPDYIIVGEVRGEEATVMFQGMASIKGEEELFLIDKDNNPVFTPIQDIRNIKSHKSFCINSGHSKILPANALSEHKVNELYEIITKKGRNVTVSPNHSLLTYEKEIVPLFAKEAKIGDKIIIPKNIPCGYSKLTHLDLTKLKNIRVLAPRLIKKAVRRLGFENANKICKVKAINDYYSRTNISALKYLSFEKLMKKAEIKIDKQELLVKFDRKSKILPALLPINKKLLKLFGYYISEGSLNIASKNNAIALYNKNEKVLKDMRSCLKMFSSKISERVTTGFGTATELKISNKVIFELLMQLCSHGAKNKTMPSFIFGLSKTKISIFLEALYTGDGGVNKKAISYYTTSKKLAGKVALLLNVYGIVAKIKYRDDESIYVVSFSKNRDKKEFLKHIKPINKVIDINGESRKDKNEIKDFYLDKIVKINKISLKKPESVYDISVPGAQNFISGFGGVILHNTGHAGLGTIHADSMPAVLDRLTNKPIDLPKTMLENLDVVVFLEKFKVGGRFIRKVKEVAEIVGYDYNNKELITNSAFRWNPAEKKFLSFDSVILDKIRHSGGYTINDLKKDMNRRIRLLRFLVKEKVSDYRTFSNYINRYYHNPNFVETL